MLHEIQFCGMKLLYVVYRVSDLSHGHIMTMPLLQSIVVFRQVLTLFTLYCKAYMFRCPSV